MVVPEYPSGADMVKSSCVSLMLTGSGRAGAVIVGRGTRVVGTVVKTAVWVGVGMVVGSGEGVGVGWTVWVHPAAISRKAIAQASTISNEIFIDSDTKRQVLYPSVFCNFRNKHPELKKIISPGRF